MQRWTTHARFVLRGSVLLALSVILTVCASARGSDRRSAPGGERKRPVFAWYMTSFYTYHGDPDAIAVAGYKRDIQDAQASGVDGFELYIENKRYIYDNTKNMFEAAKELHDADPSKPPFLLFLGPLAVPTYINQSFQGTSSNWLVYFMNAFASHPNYYSYQGKAVLGSFLGLTINGKTNQQSEWVTYVFTPLHNQGVDVFFVPTTFDTNDETTVDANGHHTTTLTPWAQTHIGALNYWTGNVPNIDIDANNAMANVSLNNGKPYVASVSGANYWSVNNSSSAGAYFEHFGGEGPAQEWQNAISKHPVFVIVTTWDDYTESYTTPVNPAAAPISTGYGIESLLKPHDGYAELMKYYAQWYRKGVQPAVTKDELIYFYRTHAKNLVATNDKRQTPIFNPGSPDVTVPDDIFITTLLTAPATLTVTSGDVVASYTLPSGVNFTRIPFNAGGQTFKVSRNGGTIILTSGEPILSTIEKYNFIPTTGFAYGGPLRAKR